MDILDTNHLEVEYKRISKAIHPDVCTHPHAAKAMSKLNALKREFIEGKAFQDDAGLVKSNGKTVRFYGDPALQRVSLLNYLRLKGFKDKASRHFQQYLPARSAVEDDALVMELDTRAVPLRELMDKMGKVPQHHVNWILSRMLEFSAWLSQMGYVHAGLNPESVFVVPQSHGIVVTSFYFMVPEGDRMTQISGKYHPWYPHSVFTEKIARSLIDLELCKKNSGLPAGRPIRGSYPAQNHPQS